MRAVLASALMLGVLLSAAPSHAILQDPSPERILFLGYAPSDRNLTIKVIRRKESYGIYAYETHGSNRVLTRDGLVGLVEGSLRGVALDPRAVALIRAYGARRGRRPPTPQKIGPYYRYYFEEDGWLLKVTTRRPFLPTERAPVPDGLISQLMAKRHVAARMEGLSRAMDLERYQLRATDDLRRIGR